ncbi:LOW QUALITY PROTEIN: uncharacterized protein EMH_0048400 [Eimeria mitis]|uniref:Uncharacterized protein n=1 Tax=Eimeria mitis TaxID=44415 RepID=U6JWY7_9EIME|nr:LOW QUALITY PROTEIN: uncharacterized protein EMH_0048400 [Eimeria mitis]CDJ29286.1 hypothetical protein, conserved [Eimeria mitis]
MQSAAELHGASAVTQWLCSANVACSQPLSCTVPVADAETELEGSEAEAAASEHLASVGLASATATATAAAAAVPAGGAVSDNLQCQDSVEGEEHCIADGGTDCAPSTPRATRGARERLLDGRKRVTAAGTVVGDGGDGCRTAVSPEALLGFERELAKLEKTADAAIACEHSLLPDMGRQGEGVSEEGAKAAAAATTEGMQQDQRQKQKLWKSLQSMLATSSRRSVDVVQQTASTAASAAGAASRALDGLVMPLLGRCMQPTTNARGGSQEAGSEEENGPERAGRKEEGQGDLQGVQKKKTAQKEQEGKRRGRETYRVLRGKQGNNHREINQLLVSGVWAGVKVGLGIATLASGHLILGGAMVAVATSSLGSALLWGRHRQEVYEIMRGDYTGDAEASQATSEGSSSAEGNTEEGSGGSGMLSGTAGGGTDSCTETQTPPQSSIAPQSCDAEEKREEKRDETDCNNATIDALTGPGDDSGDAQAST